MNYPGKTVFQLNYATVMELLEYALNVNRDGSETQLPIRVTDITVREHDHSIYATITTDTIQK